MVSVVTPGCQWTPWGPDRTADLQARPPPTVISTPETTHWKTQDLGSPGPDVRPTPVRGLRGRETKTYNTHQDNETYRPGNLPPNTPSLPLLSFYSVLGTPAVYAITAVEYTRRTRGNHGPWNHETIQSNKFLHIK